MLSYVHLPVCTLCAVRYTEKVASWLTVLLRFALNMHVRMIQAIVYGFHPLARWKLRKLPGPTPRWYRGNLPDVLSKVCLVKTC